MNLQYNELADGTRLVKLEGKLDMHGVAEVEKKLASHTEGKDVTLLLDLSQVEYIASIGIRLLLTTAKTLKKHNGRMVVLGANSLVEEVLNLSGLSQIIPIHAGLESALASLASPV
jgi:anti-sigma B factor antagonist